MRTPKESQYVDRPKSGYTYRSQKAGKTTSKSKKSLVLTHKTMSTNEELAAAHKTMSTNEELAAARAHPPAAATIPGHTVTHARRMALERERTTQGRKRSLAKVLQGFRRHVHNSRAS